MKLAERSPLLLVVDDAQWVDEPSLRFLAYLHGRLRDQPIALLVAARTGEPGEGGLLVELTGDPAAIVCEPAPLGTAAVAALVRERVPDAADEFCARCAELTAGNPLGVRELVARRGRGPARRPGRRRASSPRARCRGPSCAGSAG